MHETWGALERSDVLAPAIRIAREGWEADATHVHAVGEFLRKAKIGRTFKRGRVRCGPM